MAPKVPQKFKHRSVFMLRPGSRWNPLTAFPRNEICFCNEQAETPTFIKFKFCCLPKLSRTVEERHWGILSSMVKAKKKWKKQLGK